jgi:hypothetical protein
VFSHSDVDRSDQTDERKASIITGTGGEGIDEEGKKIRTPDAENSRWAERHRLLLIDFC